MAGKKNSGKERETDMFCCEGLRILIRGWEGGVFYICVFPVHCCNCCEALCVAFHLSERYFINKVLIDWLIEINKQYKDNKAN